MDDRRFRVTRYPPGCFSWVDGSTTDLAASVAFYSGLLGWDMEEQHFPLGSIQLCRLRGAAIAALIEMPPDSGWPSTWASHVTVTDCDAMAARVVELGGALTHPPFDIADNGRLCIFQDPHGATLHLWQPRATFGAELVNCPGAMAWNELHTPDRAASQAFYRAFLGWQFAPFADGSDEIRNRGRAAGGLCYGDSQLTAAFWRVYFAVADMDEAAARVVALGGEMLGVIERLDAENRRLLIRDPAGAECGLLELANPDPWQEVG